MNAPMTIQQYVSQMQAIPSGSFTIGRTYPYFDETKLFENEVPAHSVVLRSYKMGSTPVTVGMWREYVDSNSSISMPDAPEWGWVDNHPMVNVSWCDIMGSEYDVGYCDWACNVSGIHLTLPTEAMFEYAAKGGRDYMYPWGKVFDTRKLWCFAKSSFYESTAPVDRIDDIYRNRYCLTDMSGNVWQWCSDYYGPYEKATVTNPLGTPSNSTNLRCLRGGSWLNFGPDHFRCANRNMDRADIRHDDYGFRLVAPA